MENLVSFTIIFGCASLYLIFRGYRLWIKESQELDFADKLAINYWKSKDEERAKEKIGYLTDPKRLKRQGVLFLISGVLLMIFVISINL